MKHVIAIHAGSQTAGVHLYVDGYLLGGWFKTEAMDAATIAAEVLKVALPDAKVCGSEASLAWWNEIKTIETCLDEATKKMIGARTSTRYPCLPA
jgi:hypothetical protein